MDEKIKSTLFDLDQIIIEAIRKNQQEYEDGVITRDCFEENECKLNLFFNRVGYLKEAAKRERNFRLQLAREKVGLSQGQLAVRLGVSRYWVNCIENGKKNGSGKMRGKISEVLNTDPAILWPEVEVTQRKVAKWGDELSEDEKRVWQPVRETEALQRATEEEFNKKIGVVLDELRKKVHGTNDAIIFDNVDYQIGFQEFCWLLKKYKIELKFL